MKSHIGLTVREYSPGGDSPWFNSDDLLHDTDGVLHPSVDIRLISFADHALYLLRKNWTGISSSLSNQISYPNHHGEASAMLRTPFFFLRPTPEASLNSSRQSSSSFTLKSQA